MDQWMKSASAFAAHGTLASWSRLDFAQFLFLSSDWCVVLRPAGAFRRPFKFPLCCFWWLPSHAHKNKLKCSLNPFQRKTKTKTKKGFLQIKKKKSSSIIYETGALPNEIFLIIRTTWITGRIL